MDADDDGDKEGVEVSNEKREVEIKEGISEEVVWLNSTLHVRDFPQGPVIQVSSSHDAISPSETFVDSQQLLTTNISETKTDMKIELVYWIPLSLIGKVEICEDSAEIVIFCSSDAEKEMLRFRIGQEETISVPENEMLLVVEHIRSLLLWDKFRRLDLLEDMQREQIWLLEKDIQDSLDERSSITSDDDDASFE